MANTVLTICGTGTNASATSQTPWNNPSNITSDNETSYADVTLGIGAGQNAMSQYIKATGFGFSIPAGSTINGITAAVRLYGTAPANIPSNVFLVKAGTVQTGWTNHAEVSSPIYLGAWETRNYGTSTDTWGASPALTSDDINNTGFGLGYQVNIVTGTPGDRLTRMAWVKMTVYYTEGASSPAFQTRISFF